MKNIIFYSKIIAASMVWVVISVIMMSLIGKEIISRGLGITLIISSWITTIIYGVSVGLELFHIDLDKSYEDKNKTNKEENKKHE